jgi:hypothetical protein
MKFESLVENLANSNRNFIRAIIYTNKIHPFPPLINQWKMRMSNERGMEMKIASRFSIIVNGMFYCPYHPYSSPFVSSNALSFICIPCVLKTMIHNIKYVTQQEIQFSSFNCYLWHFICNPFYLSFFITLQTTRTDLLNFILPSSSTHSNVRDEIQLKT